MLLQVKLQSVYRLPYCPSSKEVECFLGGKIGFNWDVKEIEGKPLFPWIDFDQEFCWEVCADFVGKMKQISVDIGFFITRSKLSRVHICKEQVNFSTASLCREETTLWKSLPYIDYWNCGKDVKDTALIVKISGSLKSKMFIEKSQQDIQLPLKTRSVIPEKIGGGPQPPPMTKRRHKLALPNQVVGNCPNCGGCTRCRTAQKSRLTVFHPSHHLNQPKHVSRMISMKKLREVIRSPEIDSLPLESCPPSTRELSSTIQKSSDHVEVKSVHFSGRLLSKSSSSVCVKEPKTPSPREMPKSPSIRHPPILSYKTPCLTRGCKTCMNVRRDYCPPAGRVTCRSDPNGFRPRQMTSNAYVKLQKATSFKPLIRTATFVADFKSTMNSRPMQTTPPPGDTSPSNSLVLTDTSEIRETSGRDGWFQFPPNETKSLILTESHLSLKNTTPKKSLIDISQLQDSLLTSENLICLRLEGNMFSFNPAFGVDKKGVQREEMSQFPFLKHNGRPSSASRCHKLYVLKSSDFVETQKNNSGQESSPGGRLTSRETKKDTLRYSSPDLSLLRETNSQGDTMNIVYRKTHVVSISQSNSHIKLEGGGLSSFVLENSQDDEGGGDSRLTGCSVENRAIFKMKKLGIHVAINENDKKFPLSQLSLTRDESPSIIHQRFFKDEKVDRVASSRQLVTNMISGFDNFLTQTSVKARGLPTLSHSIMNDWSNIDFINDSLQT